MNKEEIFTIGDKCEKGIISSFSILGNDLLINYDNGSIQPLKNAIKQKTPLFTTEDGVDVFINQKVFVLNIKECKYNHGLVIYKEVPNYVYPPYKISYKYFSTMEALEEYILIHKPCLSINDIYTAYNGLTPERKLKELVKSKL